MFARHAKRDVDGVDFFGMKGRVVDEGAEALADGIGNHAVDGAVCLDLIIVVNIAHFLEAELAGCQCPLVMESGEGKRGTETACQDPRDHTHFAHADANGWHSGVADQFQHAKVIQRGIGHRGHLDDVRVELTHPRMEVFQVGRCLAEIVKADDPLGGSIAGNPCGNIFFQIDIISLFSDCHPQQGLPRFFAAAVFSSILFPAAGNDRWAGALFQQGLELDFAFDVIQPQFDELSALFGQVPVSGDHVPMAATADGNAEHGLRDAGYGMRVTGAQRSQS